MVTMLYRRLDANGDYVFGAGNQEFLQDRAAVGQAIQTRLQLLLGTWWRDLGDGLPLFQQILGTSGIPPNRAIVDTIFSNRIASTPNVLQVIAYTSQWDPNARAYSYSCIVETIFGQVSVTGGI